MREHKYILDANGDPVPCPDLLQWAMWVESHPDNITVARTEIPVGNVTVVVSTVFLRLDHSHSSDEGALPVLWESAIFIEYLDAKGELDMEFVSGSRRYDDRADALAGHWALREGVEKILSRRNGLPVLLGAVGGPSAPYAREEGKLSYCRWSTDDFGCDIYAYASEGGYEIHVASNRILGEVPSVPFMLDVTQNEWLVAWKEQQKYLAVAEREEITLEYAGDSFTEATLEDFRDRLLDLRKIGFRFPDEVLQRIEEEMAEESGGGP